MSGLDLLLHIQTSISAVALPGSVVRLFCLTTLAFCRATLLIKNSRRVIALVFKFSAMREKLTLRELEELKRFIEHSD